MSKYNIFYTITLGILLLMINSCTGKKPVFPVEPEVTFVSVDPSTFKQFSGIVNMTISFKDGDGDLGSSNLEDYNLFITDNRTNLPDSVRKLNYCLPPLDSDANNPSIVGTITVKIPATGLSKFFPPFVGPTTEEMDYSIYVVDRAGHKSNVAVSSKLTITQ